MKVIIEAVQTSDQWHFSTAPELRIYALQQFYTDNGELILRGTVGSDEPHLKVACTLDGDILQIPSIEIDSTPLDLLAYYTAIFIAGSRKVPFMSNFAVPAEPSNTTWDALTDYQRLGRMRYINPPLAQLQQMVASMIANALTFLRYGSDTQVGMLALSHPALDSIFPTAVSVTDPDWEALVSSGVSQPWINASDYGVIGDAGVIEDATINGGALGTLNSATGAFTDALIGKVIAVAGAGPGNATLITTIATVPSATSLTLTAAASGAVTNTRAVYGTDNTTPLQNALNAAATDTATNTVSLARGNYLFSTGSLTIPQGVTLQGEWDYTSYHLGYRYANEVKPMAAKGTTMVIVAGEGSATGRFILLNSLSSLLGVSLFYPSELATLATPKLYPWAIEMFGAGCSVQNVELVNPYLGIYSHIGQRQYVRNVSGLPISIGLYASQQLGTAYYSDIDFGPVYTYAIPEGGPIGPLMSWIHANGVAFKIGRVDNAHFINCGHFAYSRGAQFVVDAAESTTFAGGTGAPGGKAWAQFVNFLSDTAPFGVTIDDVQGGDSTGAAGIAFINSEFTASQIFSVPGATLNAIHVKATNTGRIGLTNCRFHLANKNIVHESGRLNVTGCFFQTWAVNSLVITGGVISLTGNLFKGGSPTSVVTCNLAWLTATGNTFEYNDGVFTVTNSNFNESGNTYADHPAGWTAPAMQNAWANVGGGFEVVGYKKKDGWVYLKGTIGGGAIGSVAFTLPAGYRPPLNVIFGVSSNGIFGSLVIESGGPVKPNVGSAVSFSLDGVSFPIR